MLGFCYHYTWAAQKSEHDNLHLGIKKVDFYRTNASHVALSTLPYNRLAHIHLFLPVEVEEWTLQLGQAYYQEVFYSLSTTIKMCCYSVELIIIPFLTIPSAILCVISMSAKNWLEAYVEEEGRGKVLFAQLSPWYLCASECTDCSESRRSNMDCFWMRDWAATGFGK